MKTEFKKLPMQKASEIIDMLKGMTYEQAWETLRQAREILEQKAILI